MTASVFRVDVPEGDLVHAGQVLLILESMKMEIPVTAPVAGRVVRLIAAVGATVSEGDLLVVLE